MADPPVTPQDTSPDPESQENQGRSWYFGPLVGLIVVVVVFILGLVLAVLFALFTNPGDAANWVGIVRDMFIILLAMEGMMIGLALIVLIIQLAALVNILQNEVQPIVDNTNETLSTVRGTAQFMSQHVVAPVIKLSAFTAGTGSILREVFGIRRTLNKARKIGESKQKSAKIEKTGEQPSVQQEKQA